MKKKNIRIILYIMIQWTFGIVQNTAGAAVWLFLNIKNRKRKKYMLSGAVVTEWGLKSSMGLGMFIFFGHTYMSASGRKRILAHEYGHTVQSCILGPLFIPVIGLPSIIWASLFSPVWRRGKRSYYDFYPEKWADGLGMRLYEKSADIKQA